MDGMAACWRNERATRRSAQGGIGRGCGDLEDCRERGGGSATLAPQRDKRRSRELLALWSDFRAA